jgi:hypothetical protein
VILTLLCEHEASQSLENIEEFFKCSKIWHL